MYNSVSTDHNSVFVMPRGAFTISCKLIPIAVRRRRSNFSLQDQNDIT